MDGETGLGVSDDLIQEQAYLVSRGVRPLAMVGSVPDPSAKVMDIFVHLGQLIGDSCRGAIPFVLPRQDMDCAMVGFASEQWFIDLLKWSYENAPLRHNHQIMGLLLGYSPSAVAEHDAREFAGKPRGVQSTPR